jgi:hypothetical protein
VLGSRPSADLEQMAQKAAKLTGEGREDPEPLYEKGTVFAFAGKKEAALHLIRIAIEQNYCALSALEHDPLLSKLRSTPEFADLLKAARSCQRRCPRLVGCITATNAGPPETLPLLNIVLK